mgnify:CR=1 FL=1
MNLIKTGVLIPTFPDGLVQPELVLHLADHGIRLDRFLFCRIRGKIQAFNTIMQTALNSPFEWFIFAERDMRPNANGRNTEPWWDADGELVAARYPTENEHAWDGDAFHIGFFRISRAALLKIQPPYMTIQYNVYGTQMIGCECMTFAAKARASGIKIVVAGEVDHTPSLIPTPAKQELI